MSTVLTLPYVAARLEVALCLKEVVVGCNLGLLRRECGVSVSFEMIEPRHRSGVQFVRGVAAINDCAGSRRLIPPMGKEIVLLQVGLLWG